MKIPLKSVWTGVGNCPILGILDITKNSSHLVDQKYLMVGWCEKWGHLGLSENRVYSQWNSHLIGIMISKTIGFRGTVFSDTPMLKSPWSPLSYWRCYRPSCAAAPPAWATGATAGAPHWCRGSRGWWERWWEYIYVLHIYINICIYLCLHHIYTYMGVCMYVCIYVYIYIYIYKPKDTATPTNTSKQSPLKEWWITFRHFWSVPIYIYMYTYLSVWRLSYHH